MGDTDYRRGTRNRQNLNECSSPPQAPVYECPSPPPVVIECSICCTVENTDNNLWDWLPFVSYPSLVGPTFGDLLIHILNLLPLSAVSWLGIGHKKTCIVEEPVACDESRNGPDRVSNRPNICHPDPCNPQGNEELSTWLTTEYTKLAEEAEIRRLTDDCWGDKEDAQYLHQRHYVLDRLAEILAKRDEHEKKVKRKNADLKREKNC